MLKPAPLSCSPSSPSPPPFTYPSLRLPLYLCLLFPAWLRHLSGPPSPPTGIHVEEITDTTASLSWRPGPDNHSPITAHTIQARTPFSLGWQAVTTGKLSPISRGLLQSRAGGDALHSPLACEIIGDVIFMSHHRTLRRRGVTVDRHFIRLLGVPRHEHRPDDEACCRCGNLISWLSDRSRSHIFPTSAVMGPLKCTRHWSNVHLVHTVYLVPLMSV